MSLENFECVQLVGKPKAKSKVLTHSAFPANATGTVIDKKKTVCWLCAINVVYSGNTSNLTYHLWRVHLHHTA